MEDQMLLEDRGMYREDENYIIDSVIKMLLDHGISAEYVRRTIYVRFILPRNKSFKMFIDVDKWYPFGDLYSNMTTVFREDRPKTHQGYLESRSLQQFISSIAAQYKRLN